MIFFDYSRFHCLVINADMVGLILFGIFDGRGEGVLSVVAEAREIGHRNS